MAVHGELPPTMRRVDRPSPVSEPQLGMTQESQKACVHQVKSHSASKRRRVEPVVKETHIAKMGRMGLPSLWIPPASSRAAPIYAKDWVTTPNFATAGITQTVEPSLFDMGCDPSIDYERACRLPLGEESLVLFQSIIHNVTTSDTLRAQAQIRVAEIVCRGWSHRLSDTEVIAMCLEVESRESPCEEDRATYEQLYAMSRFWQACLIGEGRWKSQTDVSAIVLLGLVLQCPTLPNGYRKAARALMMKICAKLAANVTWLSRTVHGRDGLPMLQV